MRWTPGGDSEDLEDRRAESGGGGGFGGGGFGGMHLGIGGMLVVGLLSLVFHQNFFALFSGGGGGSVSPARAPIQSTNAPGEQKQRDLAVFVLDDAQRTWDTLLPQQAQVRYRHAKLVLFRDSWPSGCGQAQAAVGPFYCPEDEKVYIDLSFFDELTQRFGAPGEFAQAYVIAHELGHHVQKILGIEQKVSRLQQQDPSKQNPLSVRLELQADCFAGVWANTTEQRNLIDQNDVDAGLRAAAAVGDDRLQRMSTGHVSPESFTHGSSAQRMRWFKAGLSSGKIDACNTFSPSN